MTEYSHSDFVCAVDVRPVAGTAAKTSEAEVPKEAHGEAATWHNPGKTIVC